jgi:chorismate mutase
MTSASSVRALRGATTVAPDAAVAAGTKIATQELLRELLEQNGLRTDDVISAFFTITPDLAEGAPALAAREEGWHDVPMLTAGEAPAAPSLPQSLPRCVRVLLHVQTARPRAAIRHVYLHDARVLRPDLTARAPGTPVARGH